MALIPAPGCRQWTSPAPGGVFLLVHGLGAHNERWEAMAGFFLKKDITSYAVELGDIDRPDSASYRPDHFQGYYNRILGVYDIAVKENPGKKIFLVGESMGALISFLLAAAKPGLFSGLVCISPAFVNRYKPNIFDSIRMAAPLLYNPKKQFKLPFDSSLCTRDIYYRNKLDEDAHEYRQASSKLIFEILSAQARARHVKKMTTPVLFLLAGEDRIVDPEPARAVFKGLVSGDKELIEFPGMYHSLTIDLGKESVFSRIWRWVEKRIS